MSRTYSIIIPTYNRIASLETCLAGIAALDYPRSQFEVIVVNDGGAPIPDELQTRSRERFELQVIRHENRGPAHARNVGAAQAGGDWFAFTDDDCVPAADWLTAFARAIDACPAAVFGGSILNGAPENLYARVSHLLFTFLYSYYHAPADNRRTQKPFFTSNNLVMARDTFRQVGGFDASLRNAEDRDLCARLVAQDRALVYVPGARVTHCRPMNLASFWRLHVSYGRGAYAYHARMKARGTNDFHPEPLRFYSAMLMHPWRQPVPREPVRMSVLLVLSQLANCYGFLTGKS